MTESLIKKIEDLEGSQRAYIKRNGMTPFDIRLSVVLIRMKYELINNYSDFHPYTIGTLRQITTFGYSWYVNRDADFNNDLQAFINCKELKAFSKSLREGKAGFIGASNWMKFYDIIEQEDEHELEVKESFWKKLLKKLT